MKPRPLIDQLESFPLILTPVIEEWATDEARWRPDPKAWSVIEILSHMLYAEIEDFRPRLRQTLADPDSFWSPIDPEGVIHERDFQNDDPREQIARFATERADSVAWLRSLPTDAPWENSYAHPSLGPLRAGDLLAAWTAHDALHLRQIAQRRHQITQRDSAPFISDYAGRWPG
ncbi:MAG: hypothetical protein ACI8QZ_000588 [Chlamydiales bacterium]|jgi:hypothetical protein